jgi:hypothetical protein
VNPEGIFDAMVKPVGSYATIAKATLKGQGYQLSNAKTAVLCGSQDSSKVSLVSVVAENVVLSDFSYSMDGNRGYSQAEIGANYLYVDGNNVIESAAREGGQVEPPVIQIEVLSQVTGAGNLDIVSTGANINDQAPETSEESQ